MAITNLQDSPQRQQATDPSGSYIVQAPAGSGKTEILTQRYLRLLSTVQYPEQIIALTFTRKAANEMRERILTALQLADQNQSVDSDHQRTTRQYALEALARDRQFGWQILKQPSRLRIMTIDALCQMLVHAIPFEGEHIHYAELCDKPQIHYLQAARNCFQFALAHPDYQRAIELLLTHLDNRQDKLIQLFRDLLTNRERWLTLLYQAKHQDKAVFEAAIAQIEKHELSRFRSSIPEILSIELLSIVRTLLDITGATSPLRDVESLESCNSEIASELAGLLLTSQDKLRKAFDHHVGLKRGLCTDEMYKQLKQRSQIILAELETYPDFIDSLCRVRCLPEPHYDPKQWDILQALFQLLPLLVAHLSILFTEHNSVDFAAISEQALLALGHQEQPTDLALYLDYRIQHLLIDEFQDTSIQQFQLLTQLVQGWETQDSRTLFIVGDPMQSIYRFRSAEVGLFLRAQKEGIGPVRLTSLAFTCNFRSTITIVNWVNQHFQSIFPKQADIESGAVSFHASTPVQTTLNDTFIEATQWDNKTAEAEGVVQCVIKELETYPHDNIAILVRSRHQLVHIIQALRKHHIAFQGVDIDLLANLPHIRDMYSLTEALLMPANRLAWLTILRSPWCGLSLADIHVIANFNRNKSIYWAMLNAKQMTLSTEGHQRVEYVTAVLDHALQCRHRKTLVDWLMETSKALHAEYILTPRQQTDLAQFWILLERFDKQGLIADMTLFKQELESLYSQHVTQARLQVMTIHKSKGLEFDCVMLPGLGAKSAQRNTPLFRWLTLPSNQGDPTLLLSPIKAAEEEICPLYDYLGQMETEKEHYESQRLLYVAATRAKRRLYLFDHHESVRQNTFKALLKSQYFNTIKSEVDHESCALKLPKRYYLPNVLYEKSIEKISPTHFSQPLLSHQVSHLIGTATHDLLRWIATYHPDTIKHVPWHMAEHLLRQNGFTNAVLLDAMTQIKQQIQHLLIDPIGQWIMQKHKDEQNEYALLIKEQTDIATRIIDRTFIEKDIRWIVDFKTGHSDEQTQQKYRQQVDAYAKIFAKVHPGPICCGLYFLATAQWISWQYVHKNVTELA